MAHTAPVLDRAIVAFKDPSGFAGKYITGAKIHDPGKILKLMGQIVYIHAQIPGTLRPTIGPQVVADRVGKM